MTRRTDEIAQALRTVADLSRGTAVYSPGRNFNTDRKSTETVRQYAARGIAAIALRQTRRLAELLENVRESRQLSREVLLRHALRLAVDGRDVSAEQRVLLRAMTEGVEAAAKLLRFPFVGQITLVGRSSAPGSIELFQRDPVGSVTFTDIKPDLKWAPLSTTHMPQIYQDLRGSTQNPSAVHIELTWLFSEGPLPRTVDDVTVISVGPREKPWPGVPYMNSTEEHRIGTRFLSPEVPVRSGAVELNFRVEFGSNAEAVGLFGSISGNTVPSGNPPLPPKILLPTQPSPTPTWTDLEIIAGGGVPLPSQLGERVLEIVDDALPELQSLFNEVAVDLAGSPDFSGDIARALVSTIR